MRKKYGVGIATEGREGRVSRRGRRVEGRGRGRGGKEGGKITGHECKITDPLHISLHDTE